jgi:hypothetical protein
MPTASGPTDSEAGSRPQEIVRELALLPTSRSLGPQPPKQRPYRSCGLRSSDIQYLRILV